MRTDADATHDISETGAGASLAVLRKGQTPALALGILGLFGTVIAFFRDPQHHSFFTSYFFGFFFWMGLTLGACTLTYLHHCCRGAWSLAILRCLEAANKNLPMMAVFFIPIIIGMVSRMVYPWTDPEAVAHNIPMQHRAAWMNPTAYIIRTILYFIFWIVTTVALNNSTAKQDKDFDERHGQWRMSFAAPAGVIHIVVLTFAVTDWLMSLDPAWYSTMYGGILMTGGLLGMLSLSTYIITILYRTHPINEGMTPAILKDLGNLILGFTMFWAYTSLAQFLIQWSGNLPEEISFYVNRFTGPLVFVGAIIVAGQFVAPFMMLLSGRTKRTVEILRKVALLVVVMRAIDMWWQVTPFLRAGGGSQYSVDYLFDLAAFVGIGGIWVFAFLTNMRKNTLLPPHDQRLQYAKEHAHA